MNFLSQKAQDISSPVLILFALSIPLSTSASSILGILLILIWLAHWDKKKQLSEIFHNPAAIAVLLYLALHIIGLLWTEDLEWGISMVKKQWKLLLFPLFFSLLKKEHINFYMAAFIAAIVIKASKAYLVWLGFITLPGSLFTTLGTTHVIYNPMLALAIYIILQDLLFQANRFSIKSLKIFLLFFLSINMFVTVGRTGQVAFFVLLITAVFQLFYYQSKKMLLTGLILLPLLGITIYHSCPTFKYRIQTAVTEIQNVHSQQITSMGCRVWFYQNTFQIIEKNWLTGAGTGDFPAEYKKINMVHSPLMPNTDNPHNQYLLVLSQFGLLGFFTLLAIFITQLALAFKKKDRLTPLRQAFPIFFLVIMLAESYLQVSATGFLFSLFASFLYKDFAHPNQS